MPHIAATKREERATGQRFLQSLQIVEYDCDSAEVQYAGVLALDKWEEQRVSEFFFI